jgi:hypothetical protein
MTSRCSWPFCRSLLWRGEAVPGRDKVGRLPGCMEFPDPGCGRQTSVFVAAGEWGGGKHWLHPKELLGCGLGLSFPWSRGSDSQEGSV